MEYEQREKQKDEAWRILRSPEVGTPGKAQALLRIIEAHYWRALESIDSMTEKERRMLHGKNYCRGYVLELDTYTRHWLHSNSGIVTDPAIIEYIRTEWRYEPEPSPFMAQGNTYYSMPPR